MIHKNCLEAKIAGRNRLNAHINQIFPLVSGALVPFVGQQIFKNDGSLLAKVAKVLPAVSFNSARTVSHFPNAQQIQSWKNNSAYTIAFGVRLTEFYNDSRDGQSSQTTDDTVYFGEVSKCILTKLLPFELRKTDYTAAQVIADRADYETKNNAAGEARSKLYLFGEHDNR